MSKKTLKRSLALGALMAFIITGSAWAESLNTRLEINGGNLEYSDLSITNESNKSYGVIGYGTITVQGDFSSTGPCSGVYGKNGDLKIIAKNITAEGTHNDWATVGVLNYNSGTITLEATGNVNISGETNSIWSYGNGDGVFVSGKSVAATGSVHAYNEGEICINAADEITVTGNVQGGDQGIVNLVAGNTITVTGNVFNDKGGEASIVDSASTISLESNKIEVKCGVRAELKNSNIDITGNDVKIGDRVTSDGIGSVVKIDGSKVTLSGTAVANNGNGGATINLGSAEKESVVTINDSGYGIYAQYVGNNINVYGNELNITVDADNGNCFGVFAGNDASAYENPNPATVNIESQNTKINMSGGVAAIGAYSHGVVNIKGALDINVENPNSTKDAICVRGSSAVNIEGNGDVKINGDIVFKPSSNTEHAGANANVNINLNTKESYLNGSIYVIENAGQTSSDVTGMQLGLSNGATWNVTKDSFVNTLTGTDGNVVLNYEGVAENGAVDVAKVAVGVNDNANLIVSGDDELTEAIEAGNVEADAALNALNEAVATTEGTSSSPVAKTVKTAEGKILGSYVLNEDGTVDLQESSASAAVAEAGMNLKAHWRAHMNDMNKRMGELRFVNGEAGVWTRMVRGESEYEGAKMQYNQYQLGYDEKLSVDKRWIVGAAVTFAEGDSSYGQGSSEDKSTAFAIYGTKLNNDGTFVDLIARYARLESDIEDSVYSKGEYDTNGMSVSAEFGKRIQQGNGLWIEPQVELTYGTVDSASVKFADGSVANYGDMDSLIGRVGFSIGKDIKQGNVYARASYLYDFDGETETTFTNGTVSGKPVEDDFGGGWWEVGVGANINLSKATYIYADVEKTFGGEVDTNWQWNLGVRYSF